MFFCNFDIDSHNTNLCHQNECINLFSFSVYDDNDVPNSGFLSLSLQLILRGKNFNCNILLYIYEYFYNVRS